MGDRGGGGGGCGGGGGEKKFPGTKEAEPEGEEEGGDGLWGDQRLDQQRDTGEQAEEEWISERMSWKAGTRRPKLPVPLQQQLYLPVAHTGGRVTERTNNGAESRERLPRNTFRPAGDEHGSAPSEHDPRVRR